MAQRHLHRCCTFFQQCLLFRCDVCLYPLQFLICRLAWTSGVCPVAPTFGSWHNFEIYVGIVTPGAACAGIRASITERVEIQAAVCAVAASCHFVSVPVNGETFADW